MVIVSVVDNVMLFILVNASLGSYDAFRDPLLQGKQLQRPLQTTKRINRRKASSAKPGEVGPSAAAQRKLEYIELVSIFTY